MLRSAEKLVLFVVIIVTVLVLGISVTPVAFASDPYSEKQAEEYGASSGEVMIIRFNREVVYFRNPLRKVIARVAAVKPDARYEILSIVPSATMQKRVEGRSYDGDVQAVINVFGRYGVSADRISVKTENTNNVDYHQIKIFVN